MKNSISICDFKFQFSGYGHYVVTYTSPVTQKKYSKTINDMKIIGATKDEDNPKICDLNLLKKIVKN